MILQKVQQHQFKLNLIPLTSLFTKFQLKIFYQGW
jgi:hypothetical protein